MANQLNALPDPTDTDPQETKEWMESLEGVIAQEGAQSMWIGNHALPMNP